MTNQQIRAHLREGEQAVKTLKALGYTYKRGEWHKGEDALDPIIEGIKALIASQISSPKPEPELKAGERFIIESLPAGHKLRGELQGNWPRVFVARVVADGNGTYTGRVVRFGTGHLNTGYWLPLHCVTRIPDHADF